MTKDTVVTTAQRSGTKNGHDKYAAAQLSTRKGGLTWADCSPTDLTAAAAAVTEDGAALLLSKTSDGGALLIQVLDGASKPKWYPASRQDLHEVLHLLTEVAIG